MVSRILILILCMLMLSTTVSAFGDIAKYTQEGDYGIYKFEKGFGFLPPWLGGGDKGYIQLTENSDQCLTNCYAKGIGNFYEKRNFIDGIKFKDNLGNEFNNIGLLKIEIKQGDKWKEYKGQEIKDYFEWKITVKKLPNQELDWIITIWGEELDLWAWWNSDWENKRIITINNTENINITNETIILTNLTSFDSGNNFEDIRVIENNSEIAYELFDNRSKLRFVTNINNLTTKEIEIYYKNDLATDPDYSDCGTWAPCTPLWNYSGLVGLFSFENNTNDYSGKGYNGTKGSAVNFNTSGKFGGSYDYAGTDSTQNQILYPNDQLNDLGTLNTSLSVSFWFNTDTTAGVDTFWSWRSGQDGFIWLDAGVIKSRAFTTTGEGTVGTSSGSNPNTGTWYNLVGVLDNLANTWSIYQNGVQIIQVADLGDLRTDYNYISNGYRQVQSPFDGRIDEYKVYDYARIIFPIEELAQEIGEEIQLGATITLLSPTNNENFNIDNIDFVCNASYNSSITNLTLLVNDNIIFTEDTPNNPIEINRTEIIADGTHNYTCKAVTGDGFTSQAENFIFTIDTLFPNITVLEPNGTFNLLEQSQNLTLNFTIADVGSLDNCSYIYNGTNKDINCSGTSFDYFEIISYEAGIDSILIIANDTISNNITLNHSWDAFVTDFSRTFNNETTEGNLETYSQNISTKSGISVSDVFLIYNGTSNIGEKFLVGTNKYFIRLVNFTIPSVSSEQDKTFFWSIDLSNGLNINLSSSNQTVKDLDIDNCTSFSNAILNFTLLEEEQQTKIVTPSEIEVAVNIYNSGGDNLILNFSQLTTANPYAVCLNTDLLNTSSYSLSAIIRYMGEGFANEYYNIQNLTLTESTPLQDIKLYDLNETDSTDFRLTFIGGEFLPVENALVFLDRQYISDNNFKTVELPKTDSNGQTVLHMVRNEVIYNIRIVKNNKVLGNFDNLVAFCEDFTIGDCTINLNAFTSGEEVFDYNEDLGILFTEPIYNETQGKIIFNFLTSDGSIKNVTMEVIRSDVFGNRSICTETLISSGGTLECVIDPNLDDTSLGTSVFVSGIQTVFKVISLDSDNWGAIGYLVYFIMALALALLFTESKSLILMSLVFSFAGAIGLGILNSSLIGLGASGLWLLIAVSLGIWRLNRERRQ